MIVSRPSPKVALPTEKAVVLGMFTGLQDFQNLHVNHDNPEILYSEITCRVYA